MTSIQPGRVPWNIAVLTAWRLGVWQRGGGRVVGRGGWVKEMPLSCGFSGGYPILWRFFLGFFLPPPHNGGDSKGFSFPLTPPRDARDQNEAHPAPAPRSTKAQS